MNHEDRSAIDTLFANLATVERQMPQRDAEAERVIRDALNRHPAASYYMAQTVIMQQKALEAAQKRIEELEAKPAHDARPHDEPARRGGFMSGFGGGSVPRVSRTSPFQNPSRSPFQNQGGGGGGFLAGAAQTAMGVAGGVLLGNAIAGMFGGHAMAGESPEEAPQDDPAPAEDETDADTGSDWGDDSAGYDDGGYDEGE
ncbi:DUF2076 domain-containing protein [Falsirhodobacter sp. 1013]|uniref:DUF2076 domain-containing protein n=1 Tax=Falsirhodobacter sp. 1013 TaxID=3417566 RepID=UPI003EBC9380